MVLKMGESEWNNHACLGYAILGAKEAGMSEEQVRELIRSIYNQFDFISVDEAGDVYRESDY